jgi:hypothetical protein
MLPREMCAWSLVLCLFLVLLTRQREEELPTNLYWKEGGNCLCNKEHYCMCTPSLAIDVIVEVEGAAEESIVLVRRVDNNKHATIGGFCEGMIIQYPFQLLQASPFIPGHMSQSENLLRQLSRASSWRKLVLAWCLNRCVFLVFIVTQGEFILHSPLRKSTDDTLRFAGVTNGATLSLRCTSRGPCLFLGFGQGTTRSVLK